MKRILLSIYLLVLALPGFVLAGAPVLPSLKDVAKKIRPAVVNLSIVKNKRILKHTCR